VALRASRVNAACNFGESFLLKNKKLDFSITDSHIRTVK